jgi:hypothetical protein
MSMNEHRHNQLVNVVRTWSDDVLASQYIASCTKDLVHRDVASEWAPIEFAELSRRWIKLDWNEMFEVTL